MTYAKVNGVDIRDDESGCGHWRAPLDIIAIRLPCCDRFYACHDCHAQCENHQPRRWTPETWQREKAILCRACETPMTIAVYMASGNRCPFCAASFNPGCKKHWNLYFQTNAAPTDGP